MSFSGKSSAPPAPNFAEARDRSRLAFETALFCTHVYRPRRHHPGQHGGDQDIKQRAYEQRTEDTKRQITIGIDDFLRGGRDRVNPMYAKKITAAPFITPVHPIGANGLQFSGLTKNAPTTITAPIPTSFTATMIELIRALSDIPIYSTKEDHRAANGENNHLGYLFAAPPAPCGLINFNMNRSCSPRCWNTSQVRSSLGLRKLRSGYKHKAGAFNLIYLVGFVDAMSVLTSRAPEPGAALLSIIP